MNKVLVIGLDGAEPSLIEKWEDDLPNFSDIMRTGVYGALESTIPPFSCPAWNCFMTGKNPGKIGVYDFQVGKEQFNLRSEPTIVNSTVQNSPAIWDLLSKFGYEVGVVNVPFTYPPMKVEGFMVSGFLTPPEKEDYTYPKELACELKEIVSSYEATRYADIMSPEFMRGGEAAFLKEIDSSLQETFEITKYLIKYKGWQFFMVVFTALDRIQHFFWHHMDGKHPKHDRDKAGKYGNTIKEYYQRLDEIVGTLYRLAGDEANLILMSDHGFGPEYGCFLLNNFFQKAGFLRKKKRIGDRIKNLFLKDLAVKILGRLGILEVLKVHNMMFSGEKSLIQQLMPKAFRLKHPYTRSRSYMDDVDWLETKAYAFGNNRVFINLKGREALGTVVFDEEYQEIRNDLIKALYRVKHPKTLSSIFTKIYKKGDLYYGNHIEEAPDLVLMGDKISFKMGTGGKDMFEIPTLQSGDHRLYGILMMNGPDFVTTTRVRANILDLAPTILHLFQIPIPEDMDGRVLKEALRSKRNVKYQVVVPRAGKVYKYSKEEKEVLRERLRSLGYLE